MEQAPGPRGYPQEPHGPVLGAASAEVSLATANFEICCASRLLSHLGHRGFCWPSTMLSKVVIAFLADAFEDGHNVSSV